MGGGTCGEAIPRVIAVERMVTGDHACLGFDDHEDLWAVRAAFATAGLTRGERVMLFTETSAEDALGKLSLYGVPAELASAGGQLEVVNDTPGYVPGSGFDPAARIGHWAKISKDALRRGFSGLRAAGDVPWAIQPDVDTAELAAYEVQLTTLLRTYGFTSLCEYDRRLVPPELLGRLMAAHPLAVLPTPATLRAVRDGDTLRLAGDADLATRTAFELALREGLSAPGLAAVDLTGLAFLDAYCARALLRLATDSATGLTTFPATGLTTGLTTDHETGPPAGLMIDCTAAQHRLLTLCGAQEAEGVRFRVG